MADSKQPGAIGSSSRTNEERRSEQPRVSTSSSRLDDDSKELPELGRLELGKADEQGKLLEAIQQSFDPAISAEAYQIAQQFIAGISEPSVSWADFDSELIQGAYISDSNEILLNKTIAERPRFCNRCSSKSWGTGLMIKPMASVVAIPVVMKVAVSLRHFNPAPSTTSAHPAMTTC